MSKYFLNIKPLSVNNAWQGKRFKTKAYKDYEQQVYYSLPNNLIIPEGKLEIYYTFYFTTSNSDLDNPVKMFQDILCKKYKFNDNAIFKIIIEKVVSKKIGIEFQILNYNK